MLISERLKHWEPVIERHIKRLYKYLDRQEKARNAPYFMFCITTIYALGGIIGFVLGLLFPKLSAFITALVKGLPYGP